jgi:hypothetical protein
VATVTVFVALATYLAFDAALPECGPAGDTFLGHSYWVVPLVLLVVQAVIVGFSANRQERSSAEAVFAVICTTAATAGGDLLIFFCFFAAAGCYK